MNSAKLRKDLSHLGSYGTRGVGYDVDDLLVHIGRELGLTQDWSVVIVGVGNLGHALANYGGFGSRGFSVVGLVDSDPTRLGQTVAGLPIRPLSDLERVVSECGVNIGVIATPAAAAQDVCERLVARRRHQHLELRADRPLRRRRGRRAQGRSRDRAADPGLPRAAQGRPCGVRLMSVLVVGLSHRSAPVSLLERASVVGDDLPGLLLRATDAPHVGEAVVVSTCNRVELYAVVDKFHGGVEDLTGLLAEHAGSPLDELTPHLYVHYDERTVQHLFSVVCGLDSMVVGEAQVLGQTRSALRVAQETGAAGTLLNDLFQNALRVGKRVHAETGHRPYGFCAWFSSVSSGRRRRSVGSEVPGCCSSAPVRWAASLASALVDSGIAGATVANRTVEHGARHRRRPRRRPRSALDAAAGSPRRVRPGRLVHRRDAARGHPRCRARRPGCA